LQATRRSAASLPNLSRPFVYRKYWITRRSRRCTSTRRSLIARFISPERNRNVKLGARRYSKVEIFTQVLQLTYGARHPSLKQRNTLAGLDALRRPALHLRRLTAMRSRALHLPPDG
jgi:glutamine synthetase adenylyltransferase